MNGKMQKNKKNKKKIDFFNLVYYLYIERKKKTKKIWIY